MLGAGVAPQRDAVWLPCMRFYSAVLLLLPGGGVGGASWLLVDINESALRAKAGGFLASGCAAPIMVRAAEIVPPWRGGGGPADKGIDFTFGTGGPLITMMFK